MLHVLMHGVMSDICMLTLDAHAITLTSMVFDYPGIHFSVCVGVEEADWTLICICMQELRYTCIYGRSP